MAHERRSSFARFALLLHCVRRWARVVILAVEPVAAHQNHLFRSYVFCALHMLAHVSNKSMPALRSASHATLGLSTMYKHS